MAEVNPGRMRITQTESIDRLGVFRDMAQPGAVVADRGALEEIEVPARGVYDIAKNLKAESGREEAEASLPAGNTAKVKRSKAELKEFRAQNLRRAREIRDAKRKMIKNSSQDSLQQGAAAQSLTRLAGYAPSDQPKNVQAAVKGPEVQSNPSLDYPSALTIYLPDMGKVSMEKVEKAIMNARKDIDVYAKQAQVLAMASKGWTCRFCNQVIEEGRWYSRESKLDANSRLISDDVFCSQPCQIQYRLYQQRNGENTGTRFASVNLGSH